MPSVTAAAGAFLDRAAVEVVDLVSVHRAPVFPLMTTEETLQELPHDMPSKVESRTVVSPAFKSAQRESNPHINLGKVTGYHYIMGAKR